MTWHNKDISDGTFKTFFLNKPKSIEECYEEEIKGEINKEKIKKLEEQLEIAWNFFKKLKTEEISIRDSSLRKDAKLYTVCFYISDGDINNKILNLDIDRERINIEVREPESFLIGLSDSERERIKINDKCGSPKNGKYPWIKFELKEEELALEKIKCYIEQLRTKKI